MCVSGGASGLSAPPGDLSFLGMECARLEGVYFLMRASQIPESFSLAHAFSCDSRLCALDGACLLETCALLKMECAYLEGTRAEKCMLCGIHGHGAWRMPLAMLLDCE